MTTTLSIEGRPIGPEHPTYMVADIAANHDGDLERAKALVHLAARAGADAAKFQNFTAHKIVSKEGFETLGGQQSHQSKWKQSVFDVYKGASIPHEWSPALKRECDRAGIHYFSSPYDFEAVDMLDAYVSVYKIGSGDITWTEMLRHIASKRKPILLACGASDIGDVQRAVATLRERDAQLVLMQCNTNYTGSLENFRYIHLNVLKTFAAMYPELVLGLSDHTPGHATVLGAVALGARVIEKHFTDDTSREGPDHGFAMDPKSWREMVDRTRELELALGTGDKQIEPNERDTVVLQRRCLRAARAIGADEKITREVVDVLRPAPQAGIPPYRIEDVLGRRARHPIAKGDVIRWLDLVD
jgi:N-acetylneuraminate synthase